MNLKQTKPIFLTTFLRRITMLITKRSMLATLTAFAAMVGSDQSASAALFEQSFDSLTTGSITAGDLSTGTTGGSWTFGTSGASYAIEDDGGDQAFLMDDGSTSTGTELMAKLTLDSAIDISSGPIAWSFEVLPARSGQNKSLIFEFFSGTTLAAWITWTDPNNNEPPQGLVSLNGGTASSDPFLNTTAWDQDSENLRAVTVTFNGTSVNVDWGGVALSGSVLNSVTSLDGFAISNGGSNAAAEGVYLNDIAIVPEPGSLALMGLGGLCLLKRRRRG